jgi:hypothetical protein
MKEEYEEHAVIAKPAELLNAAGTSSSPAWRGPGRMAGCPDVLFCPLTVKALANSPQKPPPDIAPDK